MSRALLVACSGSEVRATLVEDGTPVELIVERQNRASLVGNIYLGRVRRHAPGLAAAFVDIGLARDGFLPLGARRGADASDAEAPAEPPKPPAEGEALCVQVVRDAFAGKGPQLSRRLSLAGCRLVYLPGGDRTAVSRLIEDDAERDRLARSVTALARSGEGFVVRTAAEGATDDELAQDATYLRARWGDIEAARATARAPTLLHAEPEPIERVLRDLAFADVDTIRIDDSAAFARARAFCRRFAPAAEARLVLHRGPAPLFDSAGIEDAVDRALAPRVALPSGGGIVIEATEALTVIDVNSGSLTGPAEAALRTNLEAAEEAARQIRLRNLGGLIVVDFISMDDEGADESWARVLAALERALARDRVHVRLIGRTAAGLVEITRRRQRAPLAEALTEPCAACDGTGRVATAETVAQTALRRLAREARNAPAGTLAVTASPDVVTAMGAACSGGIDAFATMIGRLIVLRPVPGTPREAVDVYVE